MSIKSFLEILIKFRNRFRKNNIFTMAAAVSFYAFLSLFPFFVLLVSISSLFFDESRVLAKIRNELRIFPAAVADTFLGNLKIILETGHVVSIISVFFLVYFAFKVFSGLEQSLGIIFGATSIRSTWVGKIRAFVFFLGTTFVLLMMFLSGGAFLFIASKLEKIPLISSYMIILAADIILTSMFFTFSYKYLSERKISFKAALTGGALAAVLWEILKNIFGIYVANITRYTLIYGSIGSIILLVLWLYYSVLIYLIGAEICTGIRD